MIIVGPSVAYVPELATSQRPSSSLDDAIIQVRETFNDTSHYLTSWFSGDEKKFPPVTTVLVACITSPHRKWPRLQNED
jgi:hypothetical protein